MKRKMAVLVGLALILLLPSAAFARDLTAREAAEMVKERLTVPEDAGDFTSNYSEYGGRGQWEFQWTSKKSNVNATMDAENGDIVSFYAWGQDYEGESSLVPRVPKAKALTTAQDFLKKAVPGKYASLVLAKQVPERPLVLAYDRNYTFFFERVVSDIHCPSMGAQLTVSAATGKVTNYSLTWDYNAAFPAIGKKLITPEQAASTMKSRNAFELMYFRPYPQQDGQARPVKLVYGVNEPRRVMVDALTGEFVYNSYFYVFRDSMYDMGAGGMEAAKSKNEAQELTPIEEKEINAIGDLLTKEKAQEAVLKLFPLSEGFKLDNARLYEDDRKDRIWNLGWNYEAPAGQKEGPSGYMSASVDAKTGEVLSYSRYLYSNGSENEPKKYSVPEAKKIGEDFLKKLQPVKMSQVRYLDRGDYFESSRTVSFAYARLVNGIPFYEDYVMVEVDRVTGEILSFSIQWGKFNFPNPSSAIGLDKAFENLSAANPIDLAFLNIEVPKYDRFSQKIGLYYYFAGSQPRMVDAFTGKVLLDNGKEYVSEDRAEFTDIDGSPYKDDISLLYSLGIIGDASGKFYPENQITQADFIKMLVLASGWQPGEGQELEKVPDAWYRPYYQTAVAHGVLSENSLPEPAKVTMRIDCAHYLVSAAGFKKAADLEGIYKVPAKDAQAIPEKDAGYAAIALKMGYLKSVNGKFEAGAAVTRGEAAYMLARYMESL